MKISIAVVGLAALALSACGGGSSGHDQQSNAENAAGQLDDAAEVSDPAAAQVLENGADAIRAEGVANGANAAAEAQNVLQNAGNAQAR